MCCTIITAAGNSRGNNGTNFMSVAGPPVEAAITTSGTLVCDRTGAAVPLERGASAFAGALPGSVRGAELATSCPTLVRDAVRKIGRASCRERVWTYWG